MKKAFILFISILTGNSAFSQKINENFKYNIAKTNNSIKIDGNLEENEWGKAQITSPFKMILPMDTSKANMETEVKMMFDDKNIYISAKNYIPHRIYVVESLRRDWNFGKNDNFIFTMDTYNDQTNGFTFGVNAAGAQWDGQQYDGGPTNLNWDNKWFSAVKQFEDHWTFEAAIPFKSIRFDKKLNSWGINFSRNDLTSTEKSAWAPVPRQFPSISSAYTGQLVWETTPPSVGSNISLIPYFLGGLSKNIEKNEDNKYKKEVGMDAKIAITSSLNLDLTINPDFSQVEVDRQQTNLDRFELFFPERRQFFLENDDLFNNLGMERLRPFFSRRIGLGVPINYGARLSGKLNKNLRIGAMDIKTGAESNNNTLAQNFSVVTFQQKLFARSNITAFMISKDALNQGNIVGSDPNFNYRKFNRNVGLEYNLASQNNIWKGKALYYNSISPNVNKDNSTFAANLNYNTKKWSISGQYEKVGANYIAEVGYFQRNNYSRINPKISYLILPKAGKILTHGPTLLHFSFFNSLNQNIENTTAFIYNVEFRTKALFSAFVSDDNVKLSSDFDPTNFTGIKIAKNTKHQWNAFGASLFSKPQSVFTYGFESRYGGYFADGTRLRLATNISYRFQPYVVLALNSEYNGINLPEEKGLKDANFWLVGPRVDLTLTNNFYLTTFMQYNEQQKNTNINARLQWRYKPASDIYLVYTDNYQNFYDNIKNKAVILKMTYWWNL